jgi:GT2 family glycosyltransferase
MQVPATLSIVIPCHDQASELELCLAALAAAPLEGMECIVVDDASTEAITGVRTSGIPVRFLRLPVCRGAAAARNRGAQQATGDILVFLDADVRVHPDTLALIAAAFARNPNLEALIGSYDDTPSAPGFHSRYRNLFNCYVHHTGRRDASTFWTACGAVRRETFLEHGGFDEHPHRIDDVEFGTRLFHAGRHIELCPEIQVQHRKSWSFLSSVKTDIWLRGIPWTFVILKYGRMPNTLNLDYRNRVSVALVWLAVVLVLIGQFSKAAHGPALLFVVGACLALAVYANRRLYRFFGQHGGVPFAAGSVAAHLLHLFLCGLSFLLGVVLFAVSPKESTAFPEHAIEHAIEHSEELDAPIALELGKE